MGKIFAAVVRYIKQTDRTLIFFSLAAAFYGLLLVYTATRYMSTLSLVITQTIAIGIGFVAMIIISKIDYHTILSFWKFIGAASVLLLIITLLFGTGPSGSGDRSWLVIGGRSVQPAEFIKVAFIVTFAKHYDLVKDEITSPLNVLLLCLHGAIPIGIILLQRDMGMALVFVFMFICMLFATNVQMRYFAAGGIALLIAAPIIWNKVFGDTQRSRILALFDPNNPKYAQHMYQQNQAITALASGKIWGYGLFNGPKTQSSATSALSERQNDMIFAVAGEELGLIGCLAIILILSIILIRCIVDARHAKDSAGAMICVGAFSMFAIQTIVNLGMVLRILPVVGLTLPFFSSGGSSALSSFLAVGLVLSVYMHRKDLMFAGQDE